MSATCSVHISFEDELLGDPTVVTLACADESCRLFPYLLRESIQTVRRIPPFTQQITKLSPLHYSCKRLARSPSTLKPLSIHGHQYEEYTIHIAPTDTVLDIKYLLAPLVNHNRASDIQLNFNTTRRLLDSENMVSTGCLSSSIRIMYWFELANPSSNAYNETPIIQSVSKLTGINPLYPDVGTTIRRTIAKYAESNPKTFGFRAYLDRSDLSKRGDFEYMDYRTLSARVDAIQVAFREILGLTRSSKVGLCSVNRREWLLCDYAATTSGIVTVPLYPTLDGNALSYITNHAGLDVIVTDCNTLPDIVALLPECKTLKYIVVMNDELPDTLFLEGQKATQMGGFLKRDKRIKVLSELEREAQGGMNSGTWRVSDVKPKPDDLYTIMYTSGTTGNPKGVMITHANLCSVLNAVLSVNTDAKFPLRAGAAKVHLSYLPLAHIMERLINLVQLLRGVQIGFWRGDVNGLIEDMNVIKPAQFIAVPRIYQRIQDMVVNKMNASNFIVRWLFHHAYDRKLRSIQNRQEASAIWDKLVFQKINDAFGGNIVFALSGSAPLSQETAEFIKVCLAKIVGEGYGLTETSAGGTGTHEFDLKYGHVGQPRSFIQLKLVSVPEMDYRVTDRPNPRGEVWMKGPSIFKGYYKNQAKTDEVLTKDGWFASGDIGEWREEGRLEIIDRKKNIFKLSQGEYIRPEYIQNVYKLSRYVANVFVHGDSLQNHLVAIIVPDFEALLQHPQVTQADIDVRDLNASDKIVDLLRQDMKVQEEHAKLNGFEKVRKFKIIKEEFSTDNGLLTISMKLKRNVARKYFEKEIKELYRKKAKL